MKNLQGFKDLLEDFFGEIGKPKAPPSLIDLVCRFDNLLKEEQEPEPEEDKALPFEMLYQGDTTECPDCGGQMEWCEGCQMYTQLCCEEYGTCMCS